MKQSGKWIVYLVRCADGSLYCGITNRLENRLKTHNRGKGAAYTRSRTPVELLESSFEMTRSDALKLEHRIKMEPANRKLNKLAIAKARQKMENERIQVIQKELRSAVKSIQQLADSMGAILLALESMTEAGSLPPAKAKRAPTRKKVVFKNGVVQKIKRIPSTQIVYDAIRGSAQGMDTTALMKSTGFDQRKIHNVIFSLKKQGRIVSPKRGIYKAVE